MAIIATALVLATLVGSSQDPAGAIDPGETDTVYIADGTNFADALMGATIAALNTSPMLGVAGTHGGDLIPQDTIDELDRLTNDKAALLDRIYVFGGDRAVSNGVVTQLGDWATDIERIAGDSRWGTYEAISQMLPSSIDEAAHAQEADNADTLDGNDSTDFLGATDKAADSELVDGLDPTELTPFAIATSASATQTSSLASEDLPGATVDITVPPGHRAIIVVRFAAESICMASSGGQCIATVFVDGTKAAPDGGQFPAAFDDDGGSGGEAHAIERSFGPVGPGSYEVKVRYQVMASGDQFTLDDWHLIAEAKLTG